MRDVFFLIFFNYFCWLMLLYNVMIIVVVASISRWIFIFVVIAYKIKIIMFFIMLRLILFNLLFIFLTLMIFVFLLSTSTTKRLRVEKKNNDVETLISSINLLCSKLLILLMRCFLQLFKKTFLKLFAFLWKHHNVSWTTIKRQYVQKISAFFNDRYARKSSNKYD